MRRTAWGSPVDADSIAQTADAVGKTAKVQKSLKGFLKKISTQARVREEVREKKSAGRSGRETAIEKRWDGAREKPPEGSAGEKHERKRKGIVFTVCA